MGIFDIFKRKKPEVVQQPVVDEPVVPEVAPKPEVAPEPEVALFPEEFPEIEATQEVALDVEEVSEIEVLPEASQEMEPEQEPTLDPVQEPESILEPEPTPLSTPVSPPPPPVSASAKPDPSPTGGSLFTKIGKAFAGKTTVDGEFLDELEEILIRSDVGVKTTLQIIDRLEARVARDKFLNEVELEKILREEVLSLMKESNNVSTEENEHLINQYKGTDPFVILIVGVNGVGKTTSIGKLAHQFKSRGKHVLLGAADTFRAGAVNQLKIWSERADVSLVQQGQDADPAAVAFDTVNSAKARGAEVVLIDTAGRLHNKSALMDELTKIKRVIGKVIPEAPQEVWLVLDGSTGQNAIQQAKAFREAVDITGLILTKLDGTAKGGIVMAISNELKIPVRYIGIGEGIDDLRPFDAELFAEAILKGS